MKLPPLLEGRLVRRYKRFLADVRLDDGRVVTAHCADPGRMNDLAVPGRRVLLSEASNPRRRLRFTWELVRVETSWVCVNTQRTNAIVREALDEARLPELAGLQDLRAEVRPHAGSRLDFLLSDGTRRVWVEVKSVTLAVDGIAMFPDAVTDRGRKHLRDLRVAVADGDRAVMLFVVNREDCVSFQPAAHIDPAYADVLQAVARDGVEILVYAAVVCPEEIRIARAIPW